MSSTTRATAKPVTAEQLLRMPDDGYRYELVAGVLRKMTPAGWTHAILTIRLGRWLGAHVEENGLGAVLGGDPGFVLARDPDTVRAPDVAFIRKEHVPAKPPRRGFCPGLPDLAVEVVSPNDTLREVDEKARAWLDAGTAMVWVVDPERRNVTVYRSASDIRTLTEDDELSGEDTVAGFRCRVGDIFANL